MRRRTTLFLWFAAVVLGGFIYFVERKEADTHARFQFARRAFRVPFDQVLAFDFESGSLRIQGERVDGGWRLTRPVEAPADPAALERIWAGFASLDRRETITRKERAERGMGLDVFGLDRPRARWTFHIGREPHSYWIGHSAAVGDLVYMFHEGSEEVLSVSDALLGFLPVSADSLRDRRLLPASPGRISRIELTRPDGFVRLVRAEAGRWRIQQPLSTRADSGAARALAAAFLDSRARSFVRDGSGDDLAFGFDETGVSVSLAWDRLDAAVVPMAFGHPVPGRPGERYARVPQGVVTVSDELYHHARTPLDSLRDRALFPFEIDAVQRVEMMVDSERLELTREINGGWAVTFPVSAPAETTAMDSLLAAWGGARIERFLSPADVPEASLAGRRMVFHVAGPEISKEAPWGRIALAVEPPNPEGLIPLRWIDSGERVAVHPLRFRGFTTDPLAVAARRPLVFDPDHVRGFTTRHMGREWTVAWDSTGFIVRVPEGDSLPADADTVRNQRAVLMDLPVLRPATYGTALLAEQGLEDPDTVIRIHLSDEAGLGRTLLLGRRGPDGVYVRVGGQGITYLVDPAVADLLRRMPATGPSD